jgi:hypothetical protein
MGEKIETGHRNLRRRLQRWVTPKPQPAAGPNGPLNSSTMGLSPPGCTYTTVDPSEPVELQRTLPSQYHGQPLPETESSPRAGMSHPIFRRKPNASHMCARIKISHIG